MKSHMTNSSVYSLADISTSLTHNIHTAPSYVLIIVSIITRHTYRSILCLDNHISHTGHTYRSILCLDNRISHTGHTYRSILCLDNRILFKSSLFVTYCTFLDFVRELATDLEIFCNYFSLGSTT